MLILAPLMESLSNTLASHDQGAALINAFLRAFRRERVSVNAEYMSDVP
jgi:hypothetical protein